MAKPKQFTKPTKKHKTKPAEPETAEEFQEAADLEEETGGKWRAGDPAKSGRAFVRALEIYDRGLQKHSQSFDLAYNKARLQLEITQQPALVAHIGLPLVNLLRQTLDSHHYALRLNEENPDVLFNTSQVLTSLAEQLSEAGDVDAAIPLLREALEVLSACLSRQEMLLEQQQVDFEEAEEGGVRLDQEPERRNSVPVSEDSGQYATIENPVTASDLLDTVHASLSALTTLAALTDPASLQTLGDMAHSLTENKVPVYLEMLPADAQGPARFAVAMARANFVAAFADSQYNAFLIEAETYLVRLDTFNIPGKNTDATALGSEAEARTEFATSVMARFEGSPDIPADACWKQLGLAQELYSKATRLNGSAQIYMSRADVEMLRHRIATLPNFKVSDSIRKSAPTLAQNAQTYYTGAARLATGEDAELRLKAQQRICIAASMRNLLYGVEPAAGVTEARKVPQQALVDFVEEGLLDQAVAEELVPRVVKEN